MWCVSVTQPQKKPYPQARQKSSMAMIILRSGSISRGRDRRDRQSVERSLFPWKYYKAGAGSYLEKDLDPPYIDPNVVALRAQSHP